MGSPLPGLNPLPPDTLVSISGGIVQLVKNIFPQIFASKKGYLPFFTSTKLFIVKWKSYETDNLLPRKKTDARTHKPRKPYPGD